VITLSDLKRTKTDENDRDEDDGVL
jgi:hypothetical protein